MEFIKRIEIIVPSLAIKFLVDKMESLGVSNYSILQHVTGKFDGENRGGDMPVDVLVSSMVIVYESPEKLEGLLEVIRTFLNIYSGNCIISDAWMINKEQTMHQDI